MMIFLVEVIFVLIPGYPLTVASSIVKPTSVRGKIRTLVVLLSLSLFTLIKQVDTTGTSSKSLKESMGHRL